MTDARLPRRLGAAIAALLCLIFTPGLVRAQFQDVFMIGADNGTPGEFEQESAAAVHYYWENGNYTSLGGEDWTGGQEFWTNGVAGDAIGFPRALLHPGTANTEVHIYFQLTAAEAKPNQPLRLILDLMSLLGGTTHDLDVRLNGGAPFASRAGIAADQNWTINTTTGAAGAVAGSNVLHVRRTGGTLNAGQAWIQFDYLRLQIDLAPQIVSTFTGTDSLLRPGETCTLSWTLFEPAAAVSITPDIGDVGPLTSNGSGSLVVNPAVSTTYTFTGIYDGQSQSKVFTVNVNSWYSVFDVGVDNSSSAEFSHEVAADDNYYFAGDYSSVYGPVLAANELLNDDTDTNTVAGRTGNPAIGFERAINETDPSITIWFYAPEAARELSARHRITFDVLTLTSSSGAGSHSMEFSINGVVVRTQNISAAGLLQFEITGATSNLSSGPNYLTIRRLSGTIGGAMTFDYAAFEHLPGTLPEITGITDDPILGTRTVNWNAAVGKTYRIQRSVSGAPWDDVVLKYPTGGSTGATLFYEDHGGPWPAPVPVYRVLLE